MTDIGTWFQNLPVITRNWFALTVGFSLLGRFGILPVYYLPLVYQNFVKNFEIWRAVTAVFYYPINAATGFHFLMNLYFLYTYSLRLETGIFSGAPADQLFMMLFLWINAVVISLMFNIILLMDIMVLAVLYVWCQLNKDQIVQFWFGTQFKAVLLPWVLLAFNIIIAGGGAMEIVGILIGHLYFFLEFKYPQDFGGPRMLKTPEFLYSILPNPSGTISGVHGTTSSRPPTTDTTRRRNWGRGQALGGN